MKKYIERISWVPFKIIDKVRGKPPNKKIIDLNKIGIREVFAFNFIKEDLGLSNQLFTFGFREPLNWKHYYEYVEDTDIVLDIGANIGLFSILSKNAKKNHLY